MNAHDEQTLLDLFQKSFEDHMLTRKERAELNNELKELALNDHEKSIIRSKVFDLARSEMTETNYPSITLWLEEVSKLLIRNHTAATESQNSVHFSPGESCRNAIKKFIKSAENTLKICVFTISDNQISNEIIAAKKRGVDVRVITDDDKQRDHGSDISLLRSKGVHVRCDDSPSHMHHKFAVADKKRVLTGSYNWTRSAATSNQENILITDEKSIVHAYNQEFGRLWKLFN